MRWLKNRKWTKVEVPRNGVIRLYINEDRFETKLTTFNLLQNNKFRKAFEDIFAKPLQEQGVESVSVIAKVGWPPLVEIFSNEADYFAAPKVTWGDRYKSFESMVEYFFKNIFDIIYCHLRLFIFLAYIVASVLNNNPFDSLECAIPNIIDDLCHGVIPSIIGDLIFGVFLSFGLSYLIKEIKDYQKDSLTSIVLTGGLLAVIGMGFYGLLNNALEVSLSTQRNLLNEEKKLDIVTLSIGLSKPQYTRVKVLDVKVNAVINKYNTAFSVLSKSESNNYESINNYINSATKELNVEDNKLSSEQAAKGVYLVPGDKTSYSFPIVAGFDDIVQFDVNILCQQVVLGIPIRWSRQQWTASTVSVHLYSKDDNKCEGCVKPNSGSPSSAMRYLSDSPSFDIGEGSIVQKPPRCSQTGNQQDWNDWLTYQASIWLNRSKKSDTDLLLLIGSADRQHLNGSLVDKFDSNQGLARARAESVKARLKDEINRQKPDHPILDSQILVLTRGPENTHSINSKKSACNLAQDRTVSLWINSSI